ncbi:MAG: right-handed parallel beta-helix repeat-containing protein [Thermoproteota archaeon]
MLKKFALVMVTMLVLAMGVSVASAMPFSGNVIHVTEGGSIQVAIDSASDGAIIFVHEGTYEERLTIAGKDLKLVAVGDVILEEPNPDDTQWPAAISTITVSESECTIEGFTVDVNGGWSGIYASGGPYYGTGEVEVTITDNTVRDYNRNGITVNGEKASGIIMNNLVTGEIGSGWANNGIQIGFGATGIVKDNTVEKNIWTGEGDWTATAILLYDVEDVQVVNNRVEEGQLGIGVLGDNNKIVNNCLESGSWGIAIYSGLNNKVIRNTITDYECDVLDYGEESKVQANMVPEL